MFLVDKIKGDEEAWEVRWPYLPHFMAMDYKMQVALTAHLNEKWAGTDLGTPLGSGQLLKIHNDVVEFIADYYKGTFTGVREVLGSLQHLEPVEEVDEQQLKTGT